MVSLFMSFVPRARVPPRPRVSPELEARFPTPPEEVEEHERRVHEFEQQLSTLNTQLAIADADGGTR